MRAPDLHDIGEGFDLGIERGGQPVERGQQRIAGGERRRYMKRGREAVVRTLRFVDVVVGMDRLLPAARTGEPFVRDPCDHLVDVHVRLGAAAGLEDGQRELFVIVALADCRCGGFDGVGQLPVQPVLAIDARGGLFHRGLCMDDLDRHALVSGEWEVFQTALRLRPPIGAARHIDRSDGVGFGSRVGHGVAPDTRADVDPIRVL